MRVERMEEKVEGQEKQNIINMFRIPGCLNYYVSMEGRVFSFSGIGRKPKRRENPKELRQVFIKGYPSVGILRDGKTKRETVHRLVLETFVGPCPEGMECRHIDGNRKNNSINNLCWGTYKENQDDRQRHGTTNRGTRQGRHKLTDKDVIEIRRMATSGKVNKGDRGSGYEKIAKMFGVSKANIAQIMRKKSWFWLEDGQTRTAQADTP